MLTDSPVIIYAHYIREVVRFSFCVLLALPDRHAVREAPLLSAEPAQNSIQGEQFGFCN
jgi:hypothetical protein